MADAFATSTPSRPEDDSPTVVVTIGPVDGGAARAWIRDAEALLAAVGHAGIEVPDSLVSTIRRLVRDWRGPAESLEFVWTAEVPTAPLRALASHWAGVAAAVRVEGGVAKRGPSVESRPFYDAMVAGVTRALASVDHDGFADAFAGVMPDFDEQIPGPVAGARRVLVVDDTDDIRLLVTIALDADGRFDVVGEASNGIEAIEKAEELQPDAIVLDVAMPRMDGLTALPTLLAKCQRTRVVVYSASEHGRRDALTAGAHAFVPKSASRDALVAALLGD